MTEREHQHQTEECLEKLKHIGFTITTQFAISIIKSVFVLVCLDEHDTIAGKYMQIGIRRLRLLITVAPINLLATSRPTHMCPLVEIEMVSEKHAKGLQGEAFNPHTRTATHSFEAAPTDSGTSFGGNANLANPIFRNCLIDCQAIQALMLLSIVLTDTID
jgi:hypothetical protein